jgi:hypothetical protein
MVEIPGAVSNYRDRVGQGQEPPENFLAGLLKIGDRYIQFLPGDQLGRLVRTGYDVTREARPIRAICPDFEQEGREILGGSGVGDGMGRRSSRAAAASSGDDDMGGHVGTP